MMIKMTESQSKAENCEFECLSVLSQESRATRASSLSRESSLGHAEQLLFSCVSSKVIVCHAVTCHMSHVSHVRHGSHPWVMLNNF